ncbi:hypothetical protein LBMAG48_13180 [Phycisphaerae bacterium]|nr:hypothetical protein LBMAG48_13180 [Phycisphaerae bacterium]
MVNTLAMSVLCVKNETGYRFDKSRNAVDTDPPLRHGEPKVNIICIKLVEAITLC